MPIPIFDRKEEVNATAQAMENPMVGDRFCEHYAFWVYVVARNGDSVTTMEASAPCTFPGDAEVREYQTLDEFKKRFAYQSIPGYWVHLIDRDNKVSGWLIRA